ncbi:MAG TPA: GerMN domain-containing protein [Candidatus Acidoferrales bacterium]|nr:GerMN domain-containing protein [Candidatus Acidoferrales bacterium]
MQFLQAVLEIHLVVAFLTALCAVVFSWTTNGRRVVNAVAALQFLLGLTLAGVMGASHVPLPPEIWLHIAIALAILAAYGMSMRIGKRAGGATLGLVLAVIGILLIATNIVIGWRMVMPASSSEGTLTVYYARLDGTTLGTWDVTVRVPAPGESDAQILHDRATYAAVQAVAGPPVDVSAVRFPSGTRVRSVDVSGTTAVVDLTREVAASNGGSFQENGEFKGLVYTLTGITPINAVQITIEGRNVETLPGGHLELDAPLRRSDW